jgi:hypothetical protein
MTALFIDAKQGFQCIENSPFTAFGSAEIRILSLVLFTISEIMPYFNIPFLLHCAAGHSFARRIELFLAVSS